MVWNTTQSSLYRAVSDYNNEIARREHNRRDDKCAERSDPPKSNECSTRDSSGSGRAKKPQNRAAHRCKRCADCPNCPNCHNCRNCRNSQNGSSLNFGEMNIDRDFLLLAGLIFILSENGADKKLIAALTIALLG